MVIHLDNRKCISRIECVNPGYQYFFLFKDNTVLSA